MARPSDKLTTEELEERWTDPVATASIAKSCEFVAVKKLGSLVTQELGLSSDVCERMKPPATNRCALI
jgi:hypothetical protein